MRSYLRLIAAGLALLTAPAVAQNAIPTLGNPGSLAGGIALANGSASGAYATILNPSATAAYNFNLPAIVGASGSFLTSAGGGTSAMTWTAQVGPAQGGTGVANNAANTITFSGNYGLGLTLSGATALTLPTSGTLATSATFAAPPAIGNTTPSTGAFTTLSAGDGTVSAPGITFSTDLSSGLYRIGTHDIALATAGTKALEINSSQLVSTPAGLSVSTSLTANSSAYITGASADCLVMGSATCQTNGSLVYTTFQNYGTAARGQAGGSQALIENSNDASSSFLAMYKSRCTTSKGCQGAVSAGDGTFELQSDASDGTNWIDNATINVSVDGTVSAGVVPSNYQVWLTNSTGTMFLSQLADDHGNFYVRNGNIGIGSTFGYSPPSVYSSGTAPPYPVSIALSATGTYIGAWYAGSPNGGAQIQVSNGYSATVPIYGYYGNSGSGVGNPGGNITSIITAGTETFRIDASGHPFLEFAASGSLASFYACFDPSSTPVGEITYQATNCTTSLRATKHDIQPYMSGLADALALRPSTFVMNSGTDGRAQIGLIAEDVQGTQDKLAGYQDDKLRTVQYDRVGVVAIAAIQALNHKIDEQQSCLNSWKCRILGWK